LKEIHQVSCIYVCICIYIHLYIYMYIYIYISYVCDVCLCENINLHTYIHTYIQRFDIQGLCEGEKVPKGDPSEHGSSLKITGSPDISKEPEFPGAGTAKTEQHTIGKKRFRLGMEDREKVLQQVCVCVCVCV
jgi:hypothetical protein